MTRKDYIALAAIIREAWSNAPYQSSALAVQEIQKAIASHCADDSPKFDRERFDKACKYGP